jgi:protein-tyrosine phosphatase
MRKKDNYGYPPPLLNGQHNFRDLGGIPSTNGYKIKPRVLFRSGDLHAITEEDVSLLENFGLAMIIDFRSQSEREKRPNRRIPTVKETRLLPIHDAPREMASEYVKKNNVEGLKKLLVHEYSRIIQNYVAEYRQFFHELTSNPNIPLVFQCSAGKDRTGLATLFLLTALGVDQEEILRDYYATNYYAQAHAVEIKGILNNDGYNGEIMQPLLEVRHEYLEAAFTEINKSYLSLEHFVFKILKANPEKLRKRFLI